VLDLGLPGMSGFDILRTLKTKRASLPVLVMSIQTEEEYAVMVLKAGGLDISQRRAYPTT